MRSGAPPLGPHSLWKIERHFKDRALAALVSTRRTIPLPAWAVLVKNRRSVELPLRQGAQMLVPGMLADVLITTKRTLLAYFLGPIKHCLAKGCVRIERHLDPAAASDRCGLSLQSLFIPVGFKAGPRCAPASAELST